MNNNLKNENAKKIFPKINLISYKEENEEILIKITVNNIPVLICLDGDIDTMEFRCETEEDSKIIDKNLDEIKTYIQRLNSEPPKNNFTPDTTYCFYSPDKDLWFQVFNGGIADLKYVYEMFVNGAYLAVIFSPIRIKYGYGAFCEDFLLKNEDSIARSLWDAGVIADFREPFRGYIF